MSNDVQGLIGCFAIGGGLLYSAIKNHRKARKVQDTQRSKVASAPQGYVEFEGFAWPVSQAVETGEDFQVVYYSFQLQKEESKGYGKSRRRDWETIYSKVESDPFFLVDATGLVMVAMETAEINLETARTRNWRSISKDEKEKLLDKVIEDKIPGFPPSNFLFGIFGGNYRIVESEIFVGSPIYVSGDFKGISGEPEKVTLPGLSQFYDQVFDKATRGFKNKGMLFDKNGDKKISAEEAQKGYATIAKIASLKAKTETQKESEFSAYGMITSSQENKLLVADVHEEYLLSRLNRWMWPQFVGGCALLALSCVWLTSPQLQLSKKFSVAAKPIERATASSVDLKVTHLHQACVAGSAEACSFLLSKRNEFGLSPQYIKYYIGRACSLGLKKHCFVK